MIITIALLANLAASVSPAAPSCESPMFCTQQFDPHVCSFDGTEFRGNNDCMAVAEVKQYACEFGLEFDENLVYEQCDPVQPEPEPAPLPEPECKIQRLCPYVYIPVTCDVNGEIIKGSNQCHASIAIEEYLCMNESKMTLEEAVDTCEEVLSKEPNLDISSSQ